MSVLGEFLDATSLGKLAQFAALLDTLDGIPHISIDRVHLHEVLSAHLGLVLNVRPTLQIGSHRLEVLMVLSVAEKYVVLVELLFSCGRLLIRSILLFGR